MKKYTAFAVLLILVSACASLGLPTARSTEDRLALSYTAITQVAASTESLFKQKQISKERAEQVLKALRASLALLDQARDLHYLGKFEEASKRLELSTSTFTEAKDRLKGGNNAAGT